MKSIKSLPKLFVMLCIFVFACNKHNNISEKNKGKTNPKHLSEYFGKKMVSDFSGNLYDINKKPIKGVTITISNKTSKTDSDGNFTIINANVHQNLASIKSAKEGYRDYTLNITPQKENTKITILLKKENNLCLYWFCKHNHTLPNSNNLD